MNRLNIYTLLLAGISLMASCSSDQNDLSQEKQQLTITSEINDFVGDVQTRTNSEGTDFLNGDLIRLKIICPYTNTTQNGESTWGNTYDAFWLLKWNGSGWSSVTSSDYYDISGSYSYSGSTDIFSYYQAQATTYVYTASNWTEERLFRDSKNKLILQYCNVFHADQTREKNYLASDVMWAQQYSQTGTWNIHLTFNHVMACILITVNDDALAKKISGDAVLTIEGMPDIDQQEIVVGDYYADKSKVNSGYGYKQKSRCSYENNGKVIGIASIDESASTAVIHPFIGGPSITGYSTIGSSIQNVATYICHSVGNKTYRLIVPPCVLTDNATLWLRDDERRYSMTLDRTTFEQSHLYNVTMKLSEPEPEVPEEGSPNEGN